MNAISPLIATAVDIRGNTHFGNHTHPEAQLVYASQGVMTVTTTAGAWVVPPQRAVWVPEETEHSLQSSGELKIRTLFFRLPLSEELPKHCSVIHVSNLLRELILRMTSLDVDFALTEFGARLVEVAIDELKIAEITPLHLPLPGDTRARNISSHLMANPADNSSLKQWSDKAGASPRTIERLFKRETGMRFGDWRRQLRLLRSLEYLAAGKSVDSVAFSLGYESTSAFIAMFRRNLGCTPGHYFEKDNK